MPDEPPAPDELMPELPPDMPLLSEVPAPEVAPAPEPLLPDSLLEPELPVSDVPLLPDEPRPLLCRPTPFNL